MKIGVLLTNLGTPDSFSVKDIRKYLAEFLWDKRVIKSLPRWLWWLLLHGVILPIRPRKLSKTYQAIWSAQTGSPLLHHTKMQAEQLQKVLPENYIVAMGMRYGHPSLQDGLADLQQAKVEKLIILPLYPQYSATTTASTFDKIAVLFKSYCYIPTIWFVSSYHRHNAYIKALAHSIQSFWQQHGKPQRLLMSFHGLPQHYVEAGDPYQQQCLTTASLLSKQLNIELATANHNDCAYQVTFQSRIGVRSWLKPYTDKTIQQLPSQGVKNIQVVCPGFASDCLETLAEIDQQNRALFIKAGGASFHYIPALNATDMFLKEIVLEAV